MRKLFALFGFTLLLVTKVSAQSVAPISVSGSLIQMLLGLGGVLAVLIGSLWLLKKLTARSGATGGLMRVVAATAVGARERVVIVEVGSTWLVLGVAPGQVSALAEIPRQTVVEPPPGLTTEARSTWLNQFLRRR